MTRRGTPALILLAITLLASSCGGEASPWSVTTTAPTTTTAPATTSTAAPTTSVTTSTTTTTATTTSTTTPTTTTTTTLPPACTGPGEGSVPAGADELSSVPAILDGDDLADEFSAYKQGDTYYLHAALGNGYAARLPLDATWAAEYFSLGARNVRVDGAFNLGVPSNQVVSVLLYTGLGWAYGLFTLENCQIVLVVDEDGGLPDLWRGMGANHSDFPVCGPGRTVLQVVFGSTAGCAEVSSCPNPDITIQEYRMARNPARLVFQGETSRASTHAEFEEMIGRICTAD
jgi:hypothetical protein